MKRSLLRTVIVMILSLLSSTSLWATSYGGKCGKNITWKLNKQGDLILTGTGDMYDYYNLISPWGKNIKTLTIGDGITSIGYGAFYGCDYLTNIEIGESLQLIKELAFYGASEINLIISYAIEPPILESTVFTTNRASIEVPQGSEAKYFASSEYGWKSFFHNYCGKNIAWALDNAGALSIFGSGEMYDYAESGKNVAPWGKNITSVLISDSITRIGNNAFNGCSKVYNIKSYAKAPPTLGSNFFTGIEKKKCCVEMPEGSEIEYITAEGWKDIFNFCGETVVWSKIGYGDALKVTIIGKGDMYDYEVAEAPWQSELVREADIREGITSIGANTFRNSNLTSIEIPNSVTKIKEKAFYYTKAKSIKIGPNVTDIGANAFAMNTLLEHITVLAEEPPLCSANSFKYAGFYVEEPITLEVPEMSIDKYKNADVWKDFYKIVTDINEIDTNDNWAISVENGNIVINNAAENMQVAVYSISGTTIYQGTAKTIATPKAGIYIVRVGNKTTKVAVK